MHACLCACVCLHLKYVCMRAWHLCMYVCMYACVYVCMCAYVCGCMCAYVCGCMCACILFSFCNAKTGDIGGGRPALPTTTVDGQLVASREEEEEEEEDDESETSVGCWASARPHRHNQHRNQTWNHRWNIYLHIYYVCMYIISGRTVSLSVCLPACLSSSSTRFLCVLFLTDIGRRHLPATCKQHRTRLNANLRNGQTPPGL
jgi:hypothetical protein